MTNRRRFIAKASGAMAAAATAIIADAPNVVAQPKVQWRMWIRNLTPDRETGLGAWTDSEIARAIRSGIAKDGRPLHWQAMIWDHASNWDEEDVRALIAFLRVMPPVRRAVAARDRRQPMTVRCIRSGWTPARRPVAGDD